MESVEIPFPIEAPYFKILWGLRPLTSATSRLQCCFFFFVWTPKCSIFFKFVARLIFSQSQIYPLLNILISNNRYLIWAHKYRLGTASTCRERKWHSWLIWDRSGFSIQIYFQVNPAVKSMDWMDWMKYTEWISIFIIVKLLALCKRLQHCWPKTPTNVWSCCVRWMNFDFYHR